jgi:hypothetical protein
MEVMRNLFRNLPRKLGFQVSLDQSKQLIHVLAG